MKIKTNIKYMVLSLAILLWFSPLTYAFTYWECLDQKLKWDSNTVRVRASGTSFPSGHSFTNALTELINNMNQNPSKFDFNLTYNESSVRRGNGQNEIWFSSDPSALSGAPAITWYWYDCVDYWIFGTDVEMTEADVVFDVNRTWTSGTLKSAMWEYGGGARPFRTTAIHEFGHALALAHTATRYQIMGQDWTHNHVNGGRAHPYFGEDASNGAVFLYGSDSTPREDLGVVHWRWIGHSGEYSTHGRTRIFDSNGSELSKVAGQSEPRYYVDNGQTIQVEFTYENNGSNTHTVDLQFYLSTNDTITTSDHLLRTTGVVLGRNDVWTTTHTVTLPNNLSPNRDYYIGAIVDSSDSVSEVFENNNATYIGLRTRNFPTPTDTPFIINPIFTPIIIPIPPTATNTPFIINPIFTPIFIPRTPTPTPTTGIPVIRTPILTPLPGREKHIFIYDNPGDTSGDLTGQTDFDPLDNRNLTIAWDAPTDGAEDWHIYIRSGFSGMRFLGRTKDGNTTSFDWHEGAANLAPNFLSGPDYNSLYTFRVVRIDSSRTADDYYDMQSPVGFNLEGGNPVALIEPAMPDMYPRQVYVCDDIMGIKNLTPPLTRGVGSDVDDPNWNALQIVWNFGVDPSTVLEYHVFVRVDQGDFQFLGQTQSGDINYFWWTPLNLFKTNKIFSDGPQDGHTYQFMVIMMPLSGPRMNFKTGQVEYSIR